MNLRNYSFIIDEKAPYTNCKFGRETTGNNLTHLVRTIKQPFVLSIEADWGTGKTTFLRMWRQQLENEGFPTLYFNAWENDFVEDPLMAFIGEVEGYIHSKSADNDSQARKLFNEAKNIGKTLIAKSLPVAAKIATYGILDLDQLSERAISDAVEKLVNEKIDQYKNEKDLLIQFREKLQTFAEMITHYSDGENYRPMVFIIDELDRCRPTYAVELIERIKHLFLVNGIVFVLGIDREQLGNSVKSLFGNDMKVDGYLRRFIDLSYQLPNTQPKAFVKHLFEHFGLDKYLWEKSTRNSVFNEYVEVSIRHFSDHSEIFKLKARVIEQCVAQFNVIARTAPKNIEIFPEFLIFLLCFKASEHNSLYHQYVNGEIPPRTLMNKVYEWYGGEKVYKKRQYGPYLEACILTGNMNFDEKRNLLKELDNKKNTDDHGSGAIEYTEDVILCIRSVYRNSSNMILVEKAKTLLEMSSAFSA